MKKSEKKNRREYRRPELRSIDLVADEVLSVGCKLANSGGPISKTCSLSSCSGVGS
ncbi:MAG: hypothetical protein V2I67_09515 [Thermoanaerobaculales bacterium]|nr:hypothetical protein [Thermoanaerobaculales bacterium]